MLVCLPDEVDRVGFHCPFGRMLATGNIDRVEQDRCRGQDAELRRKHVTVGGRDVGELRGDQHALGPLCLQLLPHRRHSGAIEPVRDEHRDLARGDRSRHELRHAQRN